MARAFEASWRDRGPVVHHAGDVGATEGPNGSCSIVLVSSTSAKCRGPLSDGGAMTARAPGSTNETCGDRVREDRFGDVRIAHDLLAGHVQHVAAQHLVARLGR